MTASRPTAFRLTTTLLALVGALAGAGAAPAAVTPRTITVSGTGIVTSVPDQAEFSFGVSANGRTASAALAANATLMTRVIAALKAQGIKTADIQTAQISIQPNTNEAGTTVIDYTATNSVTARSKSVTRAGKVIDAAVGAGANLVGGPSLTPSGQQSLSRQALRAAMADARARALVIAGAAHVGLGKVISVSELSGGPITEGVQAAKSSLAASPTPVSAGTIETEATLTVTFAIG